jgi:TolB-like protein
MPVKIAWFCVLGMLVVGRPAPAQELDSLWLTDLLVLPLRSLSPQAEAKASVTSTVLGELNAAGFHTVDQETVQDILRRYRVRDTGQLSQEQAGNLSRETGVPWILIGSIDVYTDNERPEVGLSLRLLNSLTGRIIWADSRYASGADYAGLLGLGEITSIRQLAGLAAKDLIQSLRREWLGHPEKIHDDGTSGSDQAAIIIIPLENAAAVETAGRIADNMLLTLLAQRGYRVIEPGMVHEQLSVLNLLSRGGVDLKTLKILQERFSADYCLTGMITGYEASSFGESGEVPAVQVDLRLLEADTGKLIWARSLGHTGEDYVKIFRLGLINGPARLLKVTLDELVAALPQETLYSEK